MMCPRQHKENYWSWRECAGSYWERNEGPVWVWALCGGGEGGGFPNSCNKAPEPNLKVESTPLKGCSLSWFSLPPAVSMCISSPSNAFPCLRLGQHLPLLHTVSFIFIQIFEWTLEHSMGPLHVNGLVEMSRWSFIRCEFCNPSREAAHIAFTLHPTAEPFP